MCEDEKARKLLAGAYSLDTADDNVEYYREFAPIYEEQFVDRMGYTYPRALAEVYKNHAGENDLPVADIGCVTGLVADALGLPVKDIDGIDISPEMLNVAAEKSLYRNLYQIDLKSGIEGLPCDYGGLVSAGTFTFGHLGAGELAGLLPLGRKGALFCIGVNSRHLEQQHFVRVFDQLAADRKITDPELSEHLIYTDNNSDHAGDLATIVVFRSRQ